MQKKFIRMLATILLATMLVSAIACGKTDQSGDTTDSGATTTTGQDATASTMASETVDPATQPNIPDVKYPGTTFRVANGFVNDGKYTTDSMFNYEVAGEVLEDAIYARTVELEERFGIKFEGIDADYQTFINSIQAGNDEFDICTATLSNVMTIVNRKVVYDLYDVSSLDLQKAWWDQNAEEKLSFDGHLYYTFSDFVITGMDNGRAVYFNKTMHQELGLPDLYQMVQDGTWTYDKMAEMAEVAKSDLNGDGKFDENDRIGIADDCTTFYEAMLTGCDAEIVKQGEDGVPYFFCLDEQEKFMTVYQSLLETFSSNDRFLITVTGENMFTSEQSLFYISQLSAAVRMRQSDVDFGILPTPKWDEKQEKYMNVSPNGHAIMMASSVKDTDRVGTILEALSYYSSKYYSDSAVMPAYFETALTARSARDEESAETLQIIHDNISYVIKIVGNSFSDLIYAQFNQGNTNISSVLKANDKVLRKQLDKTLTDLRSE